MRKVYHNGFWYYVGYSLDDLPLARDQNRSSGDTISLSQLQDALKRLPGVKPEPKLNKGRRTTKSSPGRISPPQPKNHPQLTKSIMRRIRSSSDGLNAETVDMPPARPSPTSTLTAPHLAPQYEYFASRSLSNIPNPSLTPSHEGFIAYSRSYTSHPSIALQVEASDQETTSEIPFFDESIPSLSPNFPMNRNLATPGSISPLPTSPLSPALSPNVLPFAPSLEVSPVYAPPSPAVPLHSFNQLPMTFNANFDSHRNSFSAGAPQTPSVVGLDVYQDFIGGEYFNQYDSAGSDL